MNIEFDDRLRGSIYGVAIGDALGMPVEFKSRGSFPLVTDYLPNNHWNLPAGGWTDDTSMTLAFMDSLTSCNCVNPADQLDRYSQWYRYGVYSIIGACFDIGETTKRSIINYIATHDIVSPFSDRKFSGNGSLMRMAPLPFFAYKHFNIPAVLKRSTEICSATTHSSKDSIEYCQHYTYIMTKIIQGVDKDALLNLRDTNIDAVSSSGYIGDTLYAAYLCFDQSNSFEECVLKAVNLGDDADTVGAVAGSLAGAYYGFDAIPKYLVKGLKREHIIQKYLNPFIDICNE